MLRKNKLLGVGITNESEDDILEYLLLSLEKPMEKGRDASRPYYIVTPNPEILVYANDHPDYKKILNKGKIALPDGVGVFLGSALMGNPLRERITGVDFMEEVCKRVVEKPKRMGFLGGRGGIAERTAECLKKRYPWLEVVFVGEEWGEDGFIFRSKKQEARSKNKAKKEEIDILFVAFGHPRQEEWIFKNLEKLPVKVAMGVGGAFDYISGSVQRAPFMVRAMGFEWLYRLIKQPWRWRRQLALFRFVWLVLRERLGGK